MKVVNVEVFITALVAVCTVATQFTQVVGTNTNNSCKVTGYNLKCTDQTIPTISYDVTYRDVTTLDVIGNFTRVEISEGFRNVTEVLLKSDRLEHLNFRSFRNLLNLESVDGEDNSIKKVNFSGVELLESLIDISLQHNKISHIASCHSLLNLTNLEEINLSFNELTSFSFSCLPTSLEILDLQNNNISRLHSTEPLQKLVHLQELWLSNNKIKNFNVEHLPQNLPKLSISDNQITKLNFSHFSRFDDITVELVNNQLKCSCSMLIDYVVQFNGSSFKPDCTGNKACLSCGNESSVLIYKFNDREKLINDSATRKCFAKHAVATTDSVIEGCKFDAMLGNIIPVPKMHCRNRTDSNLYFLPAYKMLESLYIEGECKSFTIDPNYTKLRYLKVRSSLERFDFTNLRYFLLLETVDLARNSIQNVWYSDAEIASSPSILEIDLRHNNITFIERDCWTKFPNLARLQLSNNSLTEFDLSQVSSQLHHLQLQGNRLRSINFTTCDTFARLRMNMQGNDINCDCNFLASHLDTLKGCSNVTMVCNAVSSCFGCRANSTLREFPWSATSIDTVSVAGVEAKIDISPKFDDYFAEGGQCHEPSAGSIVTSHGGWSVITVLVVLSFRFLHFDDL